MAKKIKIAQVGSFDAENFGDLLFPEIIRFQLNDVSVDLFSPKGGIMPFSKNIPVYPISDLDRMCEKEKYNAIIIGGGDLLRFDCEVIDLYKKNISSSYYLWQHPVIIGEKYNIPVYFNAPGAPYNFNNRQKSIVKNTLKTVKYITVRDLESKNTLNDCGIKNVEVIPDPVLIISDLYDKKRLLKIYKNLIKNNKVPNLSKYIIVQHNLINVNNKSYIREFKKFIKYISSSTDYKILFMPIGYVHNDIKFLNKLYEKENPRHHIIKAKLSPTEMLSIISNSSGYIGTSMHGAVTSVSYGKPIMLINSTKITKLSGFVNQIGLGDNLIFDISDSIDKFKLYFASSSNHNISKARTKIINHYNNLNKYLASPLIMKNNYNYFRDILLSCYDSLNNNFEPFDCAKVYYDIGSGFNENDKLIAKLNNVKGIYRFSIALPENVRKIRIDLIENEFVCFSNLKVHGDNKNLSFDIPNSLVMNDGSIFVHSYDPQIIIHDWSYNKLKFSSSCRVLHNGELGKYIDNLNNSITERNFILNNIERKYKKTLLSKIEKIYKKIKS